MIRTGWKHWNVSRDRIESVAEHVYGVQMLAIGMWSQFGYDVDIKKVLAMLAVHELEEILIGDLTQFQIDNSSKESLGHDAINKVLSKLTEGKSVESLILEFDAKSSKEAKFAFQCDKLECDIQCKLYDEENCVDLNHQENNIAMNNPVVKTLLGAKMSWSQMWLAFGRGKYNYDENFTAVSKYVGNHKISSIHTDNQSENKSEDKVI